MNQPLEDFDLLDTDQSGTYIVDPLLMDRLAADGAAAHLHTARVDLRDCRDKSALLRRLAGALSFPAGFGNNFDALADSLRDLGWLHGEGYVVLLDHSDELQGAAEDDLDVALDIFDEAGEFWRERKVPFWTFMAMDTNRVPGSPAFE
jgi:RNAse (barnase) inhibitor barstar